MSGIQTLNLDTSVLFNYVYSKLPGDIETDRGSQRLLESSSFHCVIGPTANDEFDAACDRRFDLYDDLLDWLEGDPSEDIYEYDPTKRDIHTSSNDLTHIRYDVQHGWGTESRRKQLSDIRRCKQDIGNFQDQVPKQHLDYVYVNIAENEELLNELSGLGLDHDKDIIVDAVEINREDSICVLMALDSDITDDEQTEHINQVIRDVESESLVLTIAIPGDI
ncbi:hypothetical protein [Halococcus sp. AFM35]|uniref:hypothetical protein n=1 Tax=Halococcus sp. AFM35 TaxID=3421653 RepID=UPI003EBC20A4